MTLVVAVNGGDSMWLLADRRLSYAGRPPKDDGVKMMHLETADGVAILGYAGLGSTALGTEPADWMSNVLRGRNLRLEPSLEVLKDAMQRQLPRHLIKLPKQTPASHHVIVPAFVNEKAMFYSIDLILSPDRKRKGYRMVRYRANEKASIPPRIVIAGSGALHLVKDWTWRRSLLRLVHAYDRGKLSGHAVADHLAKLNNKVHLAMIDKSVGPSCIVAWRNRTGGGTQQCYSGEKRAAISHSPPTISRGLDMRAIGELIMSHSTPMMNAMLASKPVPDVNQDEINTKMAQIPHKPDEDLS